MFLYIALQNAEIIYHDSGRYVRLTWFSSLEFFLIGACKD